MKQSRNVISLQPTVVYQKLSDRLLRLKKNSHQNLHVSAERFKNSEYIRSSSLQNKPSNQRQSFQSTRINNQRQKIVKLISENKNGLEKFTNDNINTIGLKRINPKQLRDQTSKIVKNNTQRSSAYRQSLRVDSHININTASAPNAQVTNINNMNRISGQSRITNKDKCILSEKTKSPMRIGLISGKFYTKNELKVLLKYR